MTRNRIRLKESISFGDNALVGSDSGCWFPTAGWSWGIHWAVHEGLARSVAAGDGPQRAHHHKRHHKGPIATKVTTKDPWTHYDPSIFHYYPTILLLLSIQGFVISPLWADRGDAGQRPGQRDGTPATRAVAHCQAQLALLPPGGCCSSAWLLLGSCGRSCLQCSSSTEWH
jgi:hypothetical protein